MQTFSNFLRAKAHDTGLSQRQIADKAGITQGTFSRLLDSKNTKRIRPSTLQSLAPVLGVSLEELAARAAGTYSESPPGANPLAQLPDDMVIIWVVRWWSAKIPSRRRELSEHLLALFGEKDKAPANIAGAMDQAARAAGAQKPPTRKASPPGRGHKTAG